MKYSCVKTGFTGIRGSLKNGNVNISITWPELLWSALTVGRQNLIDVKRHGRHSELELLYRAYMIYANLFEHNQRICQTAAFLGLDPSEKGAISFFLGQTIAKHISHTLFKTPWLLHLDRYRSAFKIDQWPGKKKPDFIGLSMHKDWLVVESKGRSNKSNTQLAIDAKQQTRQIRQINGQIPANKIGIVTAFYNNVLYSMVNDPDGHDPDAINIELPDPKFLELYYHPLLSFIAETSGDTISFNERKYKIVQLREIDIEVAADFRLIKTQGYGTEFCNVVFNLAEEYYQEPLMDYIYNEAILVRKHRVPIREHRVPIREYSGPDGILVRLGKQWESRP